MAINNSLIGGVASHYSNNALNKANKGQTSALAKLASGSKFTRAADDIAALAASIGLQSSANASRTALQNLSQASSLLQVADGGLGQATNIVQRMQALSVQANSGTLNDTQRGYLNQEFQHLASELNRIAGQTQFNGVHLLNGGSGGGGGGLTLADPVAATDITAGGTYNNALAVQAGSVNVTGASPSLEGDIGDFTAVHNFDGAGNTVLQTTIGGEIYTSGPIAGGTLASGSTLTFTSADGGQFEITTGTANQTLNNQTDANAIAGGLNSALADVSFYQSRGITDFVNPGTGALNGLTGADVRFVSDTTGNNISISDFRVTPTSGAGSNANISVTINGEVYNLDNSTVTYSANGRQINAAASTNVRLVNSNDPNSYIEIDLSNVAGGAIDVGSAFGAQNLENELNQAFDTANGGGGSGGLSFQAGANSSDVIDVSIGDISTGALFGGLIPDISTLAGAQGAGSVLTAALSNITSLRAEVGSQQSRLDSAADALEIAIQNAEAARSSLADSDIASESTEYAKNSLLANLAVAMGAQSNKLNSNLLNLIR